MAKFAHIVPAARTSRAQTALLLLTRL